jgi:hypothetical protein
MKKLNKKELAKIPENLELWMITLYAGECGSSEVEHRTRFRKTASSTLSQSAPLYSQLG